MKTITIRDLRQRWPETEAALQVEDEILITRDSKPVAKLVRFLPAGLQIRLPATGTAVPRHDRAVKHIALRLRSLLDSLDATAEEQAEVRVHGIRQDGYRELHAILPHQLQSVWGKIRVCGELRRIRMQGIERLVNDLDVIEIRSTRVARLPSEHQERASVHHQLNVFAVPQ